MKKLTRKDLSLTFNREEGETKNGRPQFKFLPAYIQKQPDLQIMFENMSEFVISAGMALYFWQTLETKYSKEAVATLSDKELDVFAKKFCDEINNRTFSMIKTQHVDSIMLRFYSDLCVVANMYEDEIMDEYALNHFPPSLLEVDLISLEAQTDITPQKEEFEKYSEDSYLFYENLLEDIANVLDPILLWGEDRGLISGDFSSEIDEQLDLFKDAYDLAEDYEGSSEYPEECAGGPELTCEDEAYFNTNKADNFYDHNQSGDKEEPDNGETYSIGNYAISEFKDGQRTLQLDAGKYCRALLYKMKNPHERDFQLLSTSIHEDEQQEMLMQYTFLDWLQKTGKINDELLDKEFKFMSILNYIVSQSECTTYTVQLLAKTVERPNGHLEEDDFIRFFMEFTSNSAKPTSLRDYELGQNALEAILFIGFCAYAEKNPKADAVVIIKGYNENKILQHKSGRDIIEVPEQEAYHFMLEGGEIYGIDQEKAEKITSYDEHYDSAEEEALDFAVVIKDTQELLAQKTTEELLTQLRQPNKSRPKMS